MRTEGSTEQPYRENPPEHLKEVHWGGSPAVKWNFSQFLHLEGALPVANSPTGAVSFWIRFDPDARLTPGSELNLFSGAWVTLSVSIRDDNKLLVRDVLLGPVPEVEFAFFKFRFYGQTAAGFADGVVKFANLLDTANSFDVTRKWYHVYATWDTAGGVLSLTVNGRALSTIVYPGSYMDPDFEGPPFSVSWSSPTDSSGFPNSSRFFSNSNVDDQYPTCFSLAEFWLDINPPIGGSMALGVDKFVDMKTGRPKSLGDNGETPTGKKPAFYFRRSGKPETFVVNRGHGGGFTFARGHYSSPTFSFSFEDIADPATDPPLDEPVLPQFEPIASGLGLVA